MERQHWQDWLIGAIGLWLIISGFWLDYSDAGTATASLAKWYFAGAGIVAIVLIALARAADQAWAVAAIALVGILLIFSPWVLNFATSRPAAWNALIAGVALAGLGTWVLWDNSSDRIV